MPKTKKASSTHGFHIACANIGNENLSLIFISVIPFKATLVTAKPLFVYIPSALYGTAPQVTFKSTFFTLKG